MVWLLAYPVVARVHIWFIRLYRSVDKLSVLSLPANECTESSSLLFTVPLRWQAVVADSLSAHPWPRWTCSEAWPLTGSSLWSLSILGLCFWTSYLPCLILFAYRKRTKKPVTTRRHSMWRGVVTGFYVLQPRAIWIFLVQELLHLVLVLLQFLDLCVGTLYPYPWNNHPCNLNNSRDNWRRLSWRSRCNSIKRLST